MKNLVPKNEVFGLPDWSMTSSLRSVTTPCNNPIILASLG